MFVWAQLDCQSQIIVGVASSIFFKFYVYKILKSCTHYIHKIAQNFVIDIGNTEDADADGGSIYVQVVLHHHGHVPAHAVLCVRWCPAVWCCQVWRELGKVCGCQNL